MALEALLTRRATHLVFYGSKKNVRSAVRPLLFFPLTLDDSATTVTPHLKITTGAMSTT